VIEVRGLTKCYGSTVAVDRLSFDVPPGAVTGFLGLNGSGKSWQREYGSRIRSPGSLSGRGKRPEVHSQLPPRRPVGRGEGPD
jgi:ABC-type uncharacterized transport system ATPase subunit